MTINARNFCIYSTIIITMITLIFHFFSTKKTVRIIANRNHNRIKVIEFINTTTYDIYHNDEVIKVIENPSALNKLNAFYGCNIEKYKSDQESFVSFASGFGHYSDGALVAIYSLLLTCPTRPVSMLLVNATISEIELFLRIGVSKVFIANSILWNNISDSPIESYRWKTWSKFQLWRLIEYKKLLYIDSDTMVLNNIDDIFDLTVDADFSVCKDNGREFNSGIMLLSPNTKLYDDLILLSKIISRYIFCETEQDVIEALYSRKKRLFSCTIFNNFWFSWNSDEESTVTSTSNVIHWAGSSKPWQSCSAKHSNEYFFWANSLWCNTRSDIKHRFNF